MTVFDCFVFVLQAVSTLVVALTLGYFFFLAVAKLKQVASRRSTRQ
jgi:hypothetical protein